MVIYPTTMSPLHPRGCCPSALRKCSLLENAHTIPQTPSIRFPSSAKKQQVIQIPSDEEDDDGSREATPVPTSRSQNKRQARYITFLLTRHSHCSCRLVCYRGRPVTAEQPSSGNTTFDSIMDSEDEDEEEEVDDILGQEY